MWYPTQRDIAWLLVGVLILAVQVVNCTVYDNQMTHLTIWGWMLHGVVCVVRGCNTNASILWTTTAYNMAFFIAGGMSVLEWSDRQILDDFAKKEGIALVLMANIMFHYIPPIAWGIVIGVYERDALRRQWRTRDALENLTRLNGIPALIILLYGVLFPAKIQYPGDINFNVLFSVGFACVAAANLCLTCVPMKPLSASASLPSSPEVEAISRADATHDYTGVGVILTTGITYSTRLGGVPPTTPQHMTFPLRRPALKLNL